MLVTIERIFVTFDACIKGFNYCRPLLSLDGIFLKVRFQGCLFGATEKDTNNSNYFFLLIVKFYYLYFMLIVKLDYFILLLIVKFSCLYFMLILKLYYFFFAD